MPVKTGRSLPHQLFAASAILLAAGALIAPGRTASAAETVRIETRPFYGATVTLEAGVRVFRPLPADRRVIINPHGRTPLSLSFEDNRTESRNYNYNYNYDSAEDGNSDYSGTAAVGSLIPQYVNGVMGRHRGASGALLGRSAKKRHYGGMNRRAMRKRGGRY